MYPRKFVRKRIVRDASAPLVELLESRTLLSADGGEAFALAAAQSPQAHGIIVGGDAVSFGNGAINATAATQVFAHDFGAKGDGVSDDAAAIQQALNSAPSGAVVLLDAGKTYRLASSLVINRTVSLDGNGATLLLNPGQGNADTWFDIHSDAGSVSYSWKQTVTAGQNAFQANISTGDIRGGDWILISLGEDSGNPGQPQYQRLVRVVANDGNTLVINRPASFDITAGSLDNSIRKVAAPANNVTLRNLNLDFSAGVSPTSAVRAMAVNGLSINNITGRIAGFDLTACNDVRIQSVTGQLAGRITFVSLVNSHRSEDVELRDGQISWAFNRPAVNIDSWSRDVRIVGMSLTSTLATGMGSIIAVTDGASQVRIENASVGTSGPATLVAADDTQSVSVLNTTLTGWYRSVPTARSSLLTVNGVTYTDASRLTLPVDAGAAPAGAPSGLSVTDRDRQHISLAWDNSNAGPAWFDVQRSSDGTNFVTLATVPGDTPGYTDGLVQPGITYYYRVSAANYAGESSFSAAVPAMAKSGLQTEFGPGGLTKLIFDDVELLPQNASGGANTMAVWDYMIQKPDGSTLDLGGSVNLLKKTFDAASRTVSWQYSWGVIACQYIIDGERLRTNVSLVNNSPTDTLVGVNLSPLQIQFPQMPDGFVSYGPVVGFNQQGPTVLRANYGADAIVFANDDVTAPLTSGFYCTNTTAFDVWLSTLKNGSQPGGWPSVHRPVAPGASDAYTVSLRFGDSTTPTADLAADIYQAYQNYNPPQLTWTDRRPIGILHIENEAKVTATNPHGWWINGVAVDTTTTAGLENFRTQLLAAADTSIAVLKRANAQGMILWSVEGFGHPNSWGYLGAPDVATILSPEIDYKGAIDEYFKRFRDAGLRVGLTLRPQEVTVVNGVSNQFESPDPVQTLLRRARYAHDRWGVTLFYIDSPVNFVTGEQLPASALQALHAALPDCLFSPEFASTGYYSNAAPYAELRGGTTRTSDAALACDPDAFSMINISDGDVVANHDLLVDSVRQGNILLFNAWGNFPVVDAVIAIYNDANSGNP